MSRLRLLSVTGTVLLAFGCGGGGGSGGSLGGGANGGPANPAPSIPTTPIGVYADSTEGQIALSWYPVEGATSYNVYWTTSATDAPGANGPQGSATDPSYVANGLTDKTLYYFSVTAVNKAGESDLSTEVSGVSLPADTCLATSAETFVACGAEAQAGTHSNILVKGGFSCYGFRGLPGGDPLAGTGAPGDCAIAIHDVPVTIEGIGGAAIQRLQHYQAALIQIVDSPSVTIRDLVINEGEVSDCNSLDSPVPSVDSTSCGRTIDLSRVTEITLEDLTIANSKSVAILVNNSGDTRISHVRFIVPSLFGLKVGSPSGSLLVADCLFWNSSANAFVISDAHGTAQTPLVVTRTLFEQNHNGQMFFDCGGPTASEHCPGGQLLVDGDIDFLNVDHSAFVLDPDVLTARSVGGVEFNPTNVHDVTFTGDDIHSQSMWGVFADPNPSDFARVSFVDNKFYNNGLDPGYFGADIGNFPIGVVTETRTCHDPVCIEVPLGGVWALPGEVTVWTSNDLTDPTVTADGTTIATTPRGYTTVPRGATVVLLDGATEIDRLTVP